MRKILRKMAKANIKRNGLLTLTGKWLLVAGVSTSERIQSISLPVSGCRRTSTAVRGIVRATGSTSSCTKEES